MKQGIDLTRHLLRTILDDRVAIQMEIGTIDTNGVAERGIPIAHIPIGTHQENPPRLCIIGRRCIAETEQAPVVVLTSLQQGHLLSPSLVKNFGYNIVLQGGTLAHIASFWAIVTKGHHFAIGQSQDRGNAVVAAEDRGLCQSRQGNRCPSKGSHHHPFHNFSSSDLNSRSS